MDPIEVRKTMPIYSLQILISKQRTAAFDVGSEVKMEVEKLYEGYPCKFWDIFSVRSLRKNENGEWEYQLKDSNDNPYGDKYYPEERLKFPGTGYG